MSVSAPQHSAGPRGEPAAVETSDLSKRFGRRWALARLTFTVRAGESLLLTGHNGSGKTTLLRVIATATSATAGTLRVLGVDAVKDRARARRHVALLSHASFLYEDLTAQQNLVLFAQLLGLEDPSGVCTRMLERVGLTARAQNPVRQYSAGMRKRLSIARLLLKAPRVALLDEPFGELDPAGILAMEGFIGELKRAGTTLVLATHLIEQGQSLCERRLHLTEGRGVLS